jgi:tetratricopeptide (TPR) repeat protein
MASLDMSALKTPEKTSRRQELRRNWLVQLYAQAILFYEDHRQLVHGLGIGLLALVLAVPGYVYYQQQQTEQANEMLGQILPVYEQGNYDQALNGAGQRAGLLTIADDYGNTAPGNLASFYAANALYEQGEYDRALAYFQRFDKGNNFIGASAYAAEAAIYENRGEMKRAAEHYEQASSQYKNKLTSPRYLIEAGQAHEEAGSYAAAEQVYQQVKDEYPDSDQAEEVDRYLARVKTRQAKSDS